LSPHHDLSTAAGWVKVARPSPVPSSGFLPLSTVLATHAARTNSCESAVTVAPRRFAALFHAARAPGVALQSFPFSRSRTRSRGPSASLWVRARLAQRRGTVQGVRGSFRLSRRPLATAGLAARRTEQLGRRFPGVARASRVTGYPARVRRSSSDRAVLAGFGGRHAHFEALLPSRVRSRDDPSLARDGGPPRSVLSWAFLL